ncbi:MAG: hypothetical protein AB1698_01490 [Pseudomonadota bacterium]
MPLHSINQEQRLYVINAGHGFSCLGFEYAEKRRRAVVEWLGASVEPLALGTAEHFAAYEDAMKRGAEYNRATGKRCHAELSRQLIGLEGRRVEVVAPDGEKSRFYVGKSMGWMPCHLQIKSRHSVEGCAVFVPEGSTVRVVGA